MLSNLRRKMHLLMSNSSRFWTKCFMHPKKSNKADEVSREQILSEEARGSMVA